MKSSLVFVSLTLVALVLPKTAFAWTVASAKIELVGTATNGVPWVSLVGHPQLCASPAGGGSNFNAALAAGYTLSAGGATTADGVKETLQLLLAAKLAGRTVTLYGDNGQAGVSGCLLGGAHLAE